MKDKQLLLLIIVTVIAFFVITFTAVTTTNRLEEIIEKDYPGTINKLQVEIRLLTGAKEELQQRVQYLEKRLEEELNKEPVIIEVEPTQEVPKTSSNKTYMDYRAITSVSSPQYKLQHGALTYTDDLGLRKVGDMYCIALGTYYSDTVGDCFIVGMENGHTFKVIVGDIKANIHTDSSNKCQVNDGSILEFIVDTKVLHTAAKKMGDISYALPMFKGNIEYIQPISKN